MGADIRGACTQNGWDSQFFFILSPTAPSVDASKELDRSLSVSSSQSPAGATPLHGHETRTPSSSQEGGIGADSRTVSNSHLETECEVIRAPEGVLGWEVGGFDEDVELVACVLLEVRGDSRLTQLIMLEFQKGHAVTETKLLKKKLKRDISKSRLSSESNDAATEDPLDKETSAEKLRQIVAHETNEELRVGQPLRWHSR